MAADLTPAAFRMLRTLSVTDVARRFSDRETAQLIDGGYAEMRDGSLVITAKGRDLKRSVQAQKVQEATAPEA